MFIGPFYRFEALNFNCPVAVGFITPESVGLRRHRTHPVNKQTRKILIYSQIYGCYRIFLYLKF